jgi:hypothetical protein
MTERENLMERRRAEAVRAAAQAAVYIADDDLTEARGELNELLRTVQRLIEVQGEQ